MRHLLSVLLIYVLAISSVFGNLPPTTLKGQTETLKPTTFNFEVPNYQATKLGSGTALVETGSANELQNPNFEHSTVTTGWTTSNATPTAETSNMFEGKKSLSLALTGALSLSQSSTINAARKLGVQMVASLWVKSDDVSDLQLCSLKNGAEDKCTATGGYVQGSGWRQLTVSFLGDATSNGLKLKSTDTTGTVLVDQAYVGVGSPIVDFTPDMVYSAKVSSAGTISDENTDWLSGTTCSISDTSLFTCTFTNQVFTVAPNCSVVHTYGPASDTSISYISSVSSTQVVIRTGYTTNSSSITKNNYPFQLICQKQGADYKTSKAYVASGNANGLSAGSIVAVATTTCPTGTIAADGSAVLRSTYAELFAAIGTTHGQGDGSTTFNLPDYRGRFLRGVDGTAGNDPDKASRTAMNTGGNTGNNVGSVQTDVFGSHNHGGGSHSHRIPIYYTGGGNTVAGRATSGADYYDYNRYTESSGTIISTQGGNETRPKNAYVNYCIRTNAQNVIVGSFQGYNETPGTSRVETFSFSYGSTNATTACTASPCSYLDQIGNNISSVTRASMGQYTINFSKTFSKLKCVGNGFSPSPSEYVSAGPIRCESCNSVSLGIGSVGNSRDSHATVYCQGIPQ